MRKPSTSCERTATSAETGSRCDKNSEKSKSNENTQVIKVREDVYLLHGNVVEKNLLSNSIAAKLRRNVPAELAARSDLANKLRRENIKDYLHLTNLNKKFSSEMQRETSRLSSEGSQLLKRQEQLRRHSLWSQRNREKMNSQYENRKNTSSSTLPVIKFRTSEAPVKKYKSKQEITPSVAKAVHVERKDVRFSVYPRVPVDKDDSTYVKVFKHQGIFQPHNKYPDKRDIKRAETGILKRTSNTPEYEIITLTLNDVDTASEGSVSTMGSPREKKKKGRRVTWSGIDRDKDEKTSEDGRVTCDLSSPAESRLEGFSTPNSIKSTKSDSYLYKNMQYRDGRSKIETIGIKWALPQGEKKARSAGVTRMHPSRSGQLSKNLNPCATAMNRDGTSITRTKWGVQKTNSMDTLDTYKLWLQKLERLKAPSENDRWAMARDASINGISYELPLMSDQPNISLFSTSNI